MPAGPTYAPIAAVTIPTSGVTSTITFNSIPQTFTDLIIISNFSMSNATNILGRFNNDSGSNYSYTFFEGYLTTSTSGRGTSANIMNLGYSNANQINSTIINVFNYANSTTLKTVLNQQNNPEPSNSYTALTTNEWRVTTAITSMTLFVNVGTWNAGTTFNLYGIAAA